MYIAQNWTVQPNGKCNRFPGPLTSLNVPRCLTSHRDMVAATYDSGSGGVWIAKQTLFGVLHLVLHIK